MANKEVTDALDSWEELEESGELDKQIEKIQLNHPPLPNGIANAKREPLILSPEDIRLKCMPPEPSVKILQRPNQNGIKNGFTNIGDMKPKYPMKTLQQREQEYAEARLRILGEARSPEEDLSTAIEDRITRLQTKTEILRPPENSAGIIRLPKGPDGTSGFNFTR